jgi:LPS-assembly protein
MAGFSATLFWPEAAGAQTATVLQQQRQRGITFPSRPKPPVRKTTTEGQMLVQAKEIHYDYANERVSAVGNVQLYYNGSVLEANKVTRSSTIRRTSACAPRAMRG